MTRLSFRITAVYTLIQLDRSIRFTKLRLAKALLNNVNLGNTDGVLLININSYTNNRFARANDSDRNYTILMLSPQNTVISYDRSVNDWDYISLTETHTINQLEIRLSNLDNNITFVPGSSFIFELELEDEFMGSIEHGPPDHRRLLMTAI